MESASKKVNIDAAKEENSEVPKSRKEASRHSAAMLKLGTSSFFETPQLLPLVRQMRAFRFRNKAGEVLTFDITAQALGVFGFAFGDRVIYQKPAKLCGRVCIVIGVRDKRLWKLEERDEGATSLGNCRNHADIRKEFALKVVGRNTTLKEFIG
jgi:hypothetical protein